ncbi:hypothetical protein GCM10023116_22920 [Kistimonas scapharcae]|uniref:Uncharacterized protein n=2 Tax=Kistimonas scapharcae TaxID=1036133 RepID=A0ABP8V3N3_9GAMM
MVMNKARIARRLRKRLQYYRELNETLKHRQATGDSRLFTSAQREEYLNGIEEGLRLALALVEGNETTVARPETKVVEPELP